MTSQAVFLLFSLALISIFSYSHSDPEFSFNGGLKYLNSVEEPVVRLHPLIRTKRQKASPTEPPTTERSSATATPTATTLIEDSSATTKPAAGPSATTTPSGGSSKATTLIEGPSATTTHSGGSSTATALTEGPSATTKPAAGPSATTTPTGGLSTATTLIEGPSATTIHSGGSSTATTHIEGPSAANPSGNSSPRPTESDTPINPHSVLGVVTQFNQVLNTTVHFLTTIEKIKNMSQTISQPNEGSPPNEEGGDNYNDYYDDDYYDDYDYRRKRDVSHLRKTRNGETAVDNALGLRQQISQYLLLFKKWVEARLEVINNILRFLETGNGAFDVIDTFVKHRIFKRSPKFERIVDEIADTISGLAKYSAERITTFWNIFTGRRKRSADAELDTQTQLATTATEIAPLSTEFPTESTSSSGDDYEEYSNYDHFDYYGYKRKRDVAHLRQKRKCDLIEDLLKPTQTVLAAVNDGLDLFLKAWTLIRPQRDVNIVRERKREAAPNFAFGITQQLSEYLGLFKIWIQACLEIINSILRFFETGNGAFDVINTFTKHKILKRSPLIERIVDEAVETVSDLAEITTKTAATVWRLIWGRRRRSADANESKEIVSLLLHSSKYLRLILDKKSYATLLPFIDIIKKLLGRSIDPLAIEDSTNEVVKRSIYSIRGRSIGNANPAPRGNINDILTGSGVIYGRPPRKDRSIRSANPAPLGNINGILTGGGNIYKRSPKKGSPSG